MPNSTPIYTTLRPHGADAADELQSALTQLKQNDPLRHVTVAAPSNLAALSLRRRLGRRGLANVSFTNLPRAIELLGAAEMARQNRRPLSAAYWSETVRWALQQDRGPLSDLPLEAGLLRAVEHVFREFDDCNPDQLQAVSNLGPRQQYLIERYRACRDRIEHDWYDDRDLARAAAHTLRQRNPNAADPIGALILFLPRDPTPAQREVLQALSLTVDVRVIAGLTGDQTVDTATAKTWDTPNPTNNTPTAPTAAQLVQAPDAEEEVREAIRRLTKLAQSEQPLHRCALLWSRDDPYARIAAEQLDAAQIPWNGSAARTLAETLAGRTLIGLLRLSERRFERRAVADWMNSAPILEQPDAAPIPARRWEALSRAALIVRDPDQWTSRLAHYQQRQQDRLQELTRRDDSSDYHVGQVQREINQTQRLRTFATELTQRIANAPGAESGAAPWSEWTQWSQQALQRWLGGPHRMPILEPSTPDQDSEQDEAEAYEEVVRQLQALNPLDELGNTTAGRFAAALERALSKPFGRTRRAGDGVYAGRLSTAWGLEFDHVVIIGASEGALPVRRREGPLLSDDQRRQAGLRERSDHDREERASYLAALWTAPAASSRTLIYPRADLRGQRGRQPSRWLLESAEALTAATHVYASELEQPQPPTGWTPCRRSNLQSHPPAPAPRTQAP